MSERVGTVTWINGPVIRAQGSRQVGMMELVEVGTPYLHRAHLTPELQRLPVDTFLSEGQDDRCRIYTLGRAVARDPELGFVGDVEHIDPTILLALLDDGFVPVVATTAHGRLPRLMSSSINVASASAFIAKEASCGTTRTLSLPKPASSAAFSTEL